MKLWIPWEGCQGVNFFSGYGFAEALGLHLVKAAANFLFHGVDFNASAPKQTHSVRFEGMWGSNSNNGKSYGDSCFCSWDD